MKNILGWAGVSIAILWANPGHAVSFDAASWPGPYAGITITSSGQLNTKSFAGFTGLGVRNGNVSGEIDVSGNEWIRFTFDAPIIINSLTLGTLYPNGEFNDTVNEIARITVNNSFTHELQATGFTTATWTGSGSVVNASVARDGSPSSEGAQGFGAWQLTNPFGNMSVSTLKFQAKKIGDGTYRDSDFSIVNLIGAAPGQNVPDAGSSSVLLGLAFLGMMGMRRFIRQPQA
jgi:hypothetical protein